MDTVLLIVGVFNAAALAVLLLVMFRRSPATGEEPLRRLEENVQRGISQASMDLAARTAESSGAVRKDLATGLLEGLDRIQARVHQELETGRREQAESIGKAMALLDARFEGLRQTTERKLGETVSTNLKNFEVVAERLGKLHEATGQIVTLSQGIHDLNVLLQTPQARGAFGELTLQQLLADLFGDATEMYSLQHAIEDGERADAVIFVRPDRSQFLCVDSKFPLANAQPLIDGSAGPDERARCEAEFARDVRQRADEIRRKYIRPPRTLDFAFMFVPAESVYYQVLKNAKLHQALLRMRVIPASPNSFYAYLQALAIAFRGMKIEQKTMEIQRAIETIVKEFGRFAEDYRVLGAHLEKAAKRYDETRQDVERFSQKIGSLKLGETALIETPRAAPTEA